MGDADSPGGVGEIVDEGFLDGVCERVYLVEGGGGKGCDEDGAAGADGKIFKPGANRELVDLFSGVEGGAECGEQGEKEGEAMEAHSDGGCGAGLIPQGIITKSLKLTFSTDETMTPLYLPLIRLFAFVGLHWYGRHRVSSLIIPYPSLPRSTLEVVFLAPHPTPQPTPHACYIGSRPERMQRCS